MNNFMVLRYHIALTLCLITIINTGCASNQKINTELLEQNKSKTFKLGIVKVAGIAVGSPSIEYNKKALDKIPIEEICAILSSKYSINIDANVDRKSKVVKESPLEGNRPVRPSGLFIPYASLSASDNAYYGNLKYDNPRTQPIYGMAGIINDEDFPDIVNVIYSFDYGVDGQSVFYYDITVNSLKQEVLMIHGVVKTIEPNTGNQAAMWDSFVDYAGDISEALKRDLHITAYK